MCPFYHFYGLVLTRRAVGNTSLVFITFCIIWLHSWEEKHLLKYETLCLRFEEMLKTKTGGVNSNASREI